jgi:hypothetical protein
MTGAVSLLFLLLQSSAPAQPPDIYSGRNGRTEVRAPRVEGTAAEVTIDGVLNEPVWTRAALLTGFSQYQPTDQRPAADSTEILVWYAPNAIHFGVRAFAPPGATNGSLSDRDKLQSDDYIDIILSTFNDGRQAFVFGVSALGVQADGTINEGAQAHRGASGGGGGDAGRTTTDLSANFVYESKGRLTDYGYEVEVRIPFKSFRFQPDDVQDWGLQIIRKVAYLGHENTWTAARRDAAGFLVQSGKLKGMRGLERGLVVDLNPSVVGFQTGYRKSATRSWQYDPRGPEYGGTVRWGVTNNLILNGTFNPDFSQVEADVVAFQYDPRQALFYPERRPFFLEGIENVSAPDGLIYSRAIVKPDFAAKLTGKTLGTNLAVLTALDDRSNSLTGEGHPFFAIARGVRDVGAQSRVGFTYTQRSDDINANHVVGADVRLVARQIWSFNAHLAGSLTRTDTTSVGAPLWSASVNRNGRTFDLTARINAVDPEFRAAAGFISRTDVADYLVSANWTLFPAAGSVVETWGLGLRGSNTYPYRDLLRGKPAQDRKLHLLSNMALQGGWRLRASIFLESFGFDERLYRGYYIDRDLGGGRRDTVKFTVPGDERLGNLDLSLNMNTPQWGWFGADFNYIVGKDENFEEWQESLVHILTANARFRPTDQLRLDLQYQHQQFDRWTSGTTVSKRQVPRVKVEYQATRAIFFRFVGQYDSQTKDDRRDDERTNDPLLVRNADNTYTRLAGFTRNRLRADWLFSYQPTPGTVLFLGYGSTLAPCVRAPNQTNACVSEGRSFQLRDLARREDGFFVKWSFLYRL